MTKILTLTGILSLLCFFSFAQTRANVVGRVIDSVNKSELEFATVAVINPIDSSLISYTVTDKHGAFKLFNLPAGPRLKIIISFVGFQTFRKFIVLTKGTTLNCDSIKLKSQQKILTGVNIVDKTPPVLIKKDTIEFSAEAFKAPPNAVVEELLKRLPGLQVDMDGTISINGKLISKLLVNGKPFFANDPRIATRNLDAILVDKVQIYDDRTNDPDHLIPEVEINKIINLKLKKAIKKSSFGKVYAGLGSRDRYDAGLLYNIFRDTLQVSLIGLGNNLNHTGFSNNELADLGGFNRSGSEAYKNLPIGGNNNGIQNLTSGGLNFNTDYSNKMKLNFFYFGSHTNDIVRSSSNNQQFLSDTSIINNKVLMGNHVTSNQTISSLIEWDPNTSTQIKYEPSLTFTSDNNTSDEAINTFGSSQKLNDENNRINYQSSALQFRHNFSFSQNFKTPGSALSISHSLNINPGQSVNHSNYDLTSYTNIVPSSGLHLLENSANKNFSTSLTLNYRYPISKKIIGNIGFYNIYNQSDGSLFTYNQNLQTGVYDNYIDTLSHLLERRELTEILQPVLTITPDKNIRLVVGVKIQFNHIVNQFNRHLPDFYQHDLYFLPDINISNKNFSLSYYTEIRLPTINDLLPYSTFYNQLFSTIGNPLLKTTYEHRLGLTFYHFNMINSTNANIFFDGSIRENDIFYKQSVSSQGAVVSKPVNQSGSYNLNLGINLGKGFSKINHWKVRINTMLSTNYKHDFVEVNNENGFQNTLAVNLNQQFFIYWNDKIEINPSVKISPIITTYQQVTYRSLIYIPQSLNIPVVTNWVKHMTFLVDYTYTHNPLVASGFQQNLNILNFSLARQFQFHDRGEIKISCYDLFDQNINSFRLVSGNSVFYQQNQILKRYFLLTYSYRFNKTINKN